MAKAKDPWVPQDEAHVVEARKRQARALLVAVPVLAGVAAAAWYFAPHPAEAACLQDAHFYANRAALQGNATAELADATLAQTYLMLQSMGQSCELVDVHVSAPAGTSAPPEGTTHECVPGPIGGPCIVPKTDGQP